MEAGCKENLVVFQNMIMVMISEWSWPWSRNCHDQPTLIMGDVCDHWSSLERAQQCRDLSLKIAKPVHVEYQATALKTEPALWSDRPLKLDREPVLSQNNQFANPSHLTKTRSGSNFTTSSAHLGPQLQERSTLYFFARPNQSKFAKLSFSCNFEADGGKANKQSLNNDMTRRGRLTMSRVKTCDILCVAKEWQKVSAWVWWQLCWSVSCSTSSSVICNHRLERTNLRITTQSLGVRQSLLFPEIILIVFDPPHPNESQSSQSFPIWYQPRVTHFLSRRPKQFLNFKLGVMKQYSLKKL